MAITKAILIAAAATTATATAATATPAATATAPAITMFYSVGNFIIPTDELIFLRGVGSTTKPRSWAMS